MTEGATATWFDRARRLGRSHLATQAAVLLPVIAIAGLTGWTMLSTPTSARSPASGQDTATTSQAATQGAAAPRKRAALETAPASLPRAGPADTSAVNGLKISSQSWRRG